MSATESRPSSDSTASDGDEQVRPMIPRPAPQLSLSLVEPSRPRRRPTRSLRLFRSLCRTLPIFTPECKLPAPCNHHPTTTVGHPERPTSGRRNLSGSRVTGTLFGHRRGRVSLCIQESPRCLPTAVIELALQTHALMREMSSGMVRIALEAEKRVDSGPRGLLDEPLWTMFCNGKKSGYGVRREATDEDLGVMELLRAVSMGAGVLPGLSEVEKAEAEMAYMRAYFEHVVGSRDSETLYMLAPDGNNGPELTVFFVRI